MNQTENMKARILRKLRSIPTPTWRVSQANTDIQPFSSANLGKDHRNRVIQTTVDVKEPKPGSGPSADRGEMSVPSVRPNEAQLHSSELNLPEEVRLVSVHESSPPDFHVSSEAAESSDHLPLSVTLKDIEDNAKCELVEGDKDKPLPISEFEDRCPPGGRDSVVLYTTSLRGIRKTFEDCNTIRFLLESFWIMYSERDISMHLEYREELWGILGGRVVPPRLFIRGRYIGGADEVVGLHEKGMLQSLLHGIPLSPSDRRPCKGCAGMRFVLCSNCDGSRKVMPEGQTNEPSFRCPDCNENGLVKCSICN